MGGVRHEVGGGRLGKKMWEVVDWEGGGIVGGGRLIVGPKLWEVGDWGSNYMWEVEDWYPCVTPSLDVLFSLNLTS